MELKSLDQIKDEYFGVKVHQIVIVLNVSWKLCVLAFKSAMPVRRKK